MTWEAPSVRVNKTTTTNMKVNLSDLCMNRFRFLPAAVGATLGLLAGCFIGYGIHRLVSGGWTGAGCTRSGSEEFDVSNYFQKVALFLSYFAFYPSGQFENH